LRAQRNTGDSEPGDDGKVWPGNRIHLGWVLKTDQTNLLDSGPDIKD